MAVTTGTMKAIRMHLFGGPEVLQFEDAPAPEPRAGDVFVRVYAAGVNPVDWKMREGRVGRVSLPRTVGIDFSGVVDGVGSEVHEFVVGAPVFGQAKSGSYAEYATAAAESVAMKPDALDHLSAAAIPVAGLTAWQALFDAADLRVGQTVLVHGAAGGVGTFAVQFAHWKGARVIGTASARNLELVRLLGADEAVDYERQSFEEAARRLGGVDVVIDPIGGATQARSWGVMRPGGTLVSLVEAPSPPPWAAENQVRGVLWIQRPWRDQLERIGDLAAAGAIRVAVTEVLPLREARGAHELSESRHARGKIVLVVREEGE